jgi:hypothetical protein
MMNKYENILPIDKHVAEQIFASGDVEKICYTLVAVGLYEKDWKWAQDSCLKFLLSSNDDISGLAATCLGHIARAHGKLEKEKVLEALKTYSANREIAGQIQDALDDIEMFLK